MKASLNGRYETDKNSGATTLAVKAGDVKLRATMTEATVSNGLALNGLSLAVEKPGFFMVGYNVPEKFMNTVRVFEKPLNLTYIHSRGDNRTILDGSLVVDSANKVSANHVLGSGNCKVKYSYVHRGNTTFEPSYDVAKNSWDFAFSQKAFGEDVFRASYQTSNKMLGLDWSRNSIPNGSFKVSASVNLAEDLKMPKLAAETTFNFDM